MSPWRPRRDTGCVTRGDACHRPAPARWCGRHRPDPRRVRPLPCSKRHSSRSASRTCWPGRRRPCRTCPTPGSADRGRTRQSSRWCHRGPASRSGSRRRGTGAIRRTRKTAMRLRLAARIPIRWNPEGRGGRRRRRRRWRSASGRWAGPLSDHRRRCGSITGVRRRRTGPLESCRTRRCRSASQRCRCDARSTTRYSRTLDA